MRGESTTKYNLNINETKLVFFYLKNCEKVWRVLAVNRVVDIFAEQVKHYTGPTYPQGVTTRLHGTRGQQSYT